MEWLRGGFYCRSEREQPEASGRVQSRERKQWTELGHESRAEQSRAEQSRELEMRDWGKLRDEDSAGKRGSLARLAGL